MKRVKCFYKDGLLDGEWLSWFRNGQLFEKTYYKEDLHNGENIQWDEYGCLQFRNMYNNGQFVRKEKC